MCGGGRDLFVKIEPPVSELNRARLFDIQRDLEKRPDAWCSVVQCAQCVGVWFGVLQ